MGSSTRLRHDQRRSPLPDRVVEDEPAAGDPDDWPQGLAPVRSTQYVLAVPDEGDPDWLEVVDAELEATGAPFPPELGVVVRRLISAGLVPGSFFVIWSAGVIVSPEDEARIGDMMTIETGTFPVDLDELWCFATPACALGEQP